jgi:hypothetical protein
MMVENKIIEKKKFWEKNWFFISTLYFSASIFLAIYLFKEKSMAQGFGFPWDDAWIFWVFAKNLATGGGFSFNTGTPVLGTTSLLWVFILSFSYKIISSPVFISKFWGIVFFFGSIFFTYKLVYSVVKERKIAFLGTFFFLSLPQTLNATLSGMENSLATFLVVLSLYFHLKRKERVSKFWFINAILWALAGMTRPELFILAPIFLIDLWWRNFLEKGKRFFKAFTKIWIFEILLFMVATVPYFTFNLSLTGKVFPNTLAAKVLDAGLLWGLQNSNWNEIIISLTLAPFIWVITAFIGYIFLNLFFAFLFGLGLFHSVLTKSFRIFPILLFILPVTRGIIAPYANPLSGGYRYVSFLIPVIGIIFALGTKVSLETISDTRVIQKFKRIGIIVSSLALVFLIFSLFHPLVKIGSILPFIKNYYFPPLQQKFFLVINNFAGARYLFWASFFIFSGFFLLYWWKIFFTKFKKILIGFLVVAGIILQIAFSFAWSSRFGLSVKNINELQVHLGKWMKENIPKNSLVAINDIGAIKFFGEKRCFDLEGLASPEIIPYKIMGKESYIYYLEKIRPDYFIIFPSWYPFLVNALQMQKTTVYTVELMDNIAAGATGFMIVSKVDWEWFDKTFPALNQYSLEIFIPQKSFRRRWFQAQEKMALLPDWLVYYFNGNNFEREGDLTKAKSFYEKASSYNPEDERLYLQLGYLYFRLNEKSLAQKQFELFKKYHISFPLDSILAEQQKKGNIK